VKTTAQIIREYRGPALFSFGFRPFFLLAAIWAALAILLWLLSILNATGNMAAVFTRDWHVHEMLFGYTSAVIVGYMIIAGANRTGSYHVAWRPIMVLAGLWVAGRIAMLAQPALGPLAAIIDASFLFLFALALWREQFAAENWRSLGPCIILSLLAIANIGFHARTIMPDLGALSERAAIGLIIFLIAMMGGRLVPSFTRNWVAQRKIKTEPAPYGRFDIGVLALVGAAIAAWVLKPEATLSGILLTAAGAGLFIRLLRWQGWLAIIDGMVFILHVAYFWCAFGLIMLGASVLIPAQVPQSAAIHALTAGAIGTMTLAIMTRTSRSHTGRDRHADRATLLIYALINAAAVARVASPFIAPFYVGLLILSALCWSLAFSIFTLAYGPMLILPKRSVVVQRQSKGA
jgi:uncharacterized protein involved in response to NO